MIPTGTVLVLGQLHTHEPYVEVIRAAIAGLVAMVPSGLVLLTNVTFAVSVQRLARRKTVVQELQSVETLARVDIVCLDKTGTLTEGTFDVEAVDDLGSGMPFDVALGALAAAEEHPNSTLQAIAASYPSRGGGYTVRSSVPFASGRGWSAVTLEGTSAGTWVLGAPEVLTAATPSADGVRARAEQHASTGSRVVMLGWGQQGIDSMALPQPLTPVVLLVLSERLRPNAADTLRYFADQGVEVRVISGDSPVTAAAIARRAGVAVKGDPVDARSLEGGSAELAAVITDNTVFGRVSPTRKRDLIAALQSRGHTVAMVGDGVNDVLALKQADMGIAMRGSTAVARAVAQIALLGEGFAALPGVVAEGRRVIYSVETVSKLYVTQTVYAIVFACASAIAVIPYPFLSAQISFVTWFTVGIPSYILALSPSNERARPGFLTRVLQWAVPAGVITAVATFATYLLALNGTVGTTLDEARTAAAIVLAGIGLWQITALDRPMRPLRMWLALSEGTLLAIAFTIPFVRSYFASSCPARLCGWPRSASSI